MALVKCPRCELNYILDGGELCTVCRREVKGERETIDMPEMCSECGENPAISGNDLCIFCLKEMNANNDRHEDENEGRVSESSLGIDPVSSMDEIIPEMDEDIPEREYDEIENDLSLDALGEEEDMDDEDEEE